jgi:hypothetical protein
MSPDYSNYSEFCVTNKDAHRRLFSTHRLASAKLKKELYRRHVQKSAFSLSSEDAKK